MTDFSQFLCMLAAIGAFIALVWNGLSVVASTLLCSALFILLTGMPAGEAVFTVFAGEIGRVFREYLLLFLFSALFGRLISDSGIAGAVARAIAGRVRALPKARQMFFGVLSIPAISFVLTYCGISMFVVVFTLISIARSLFSELDIPWHYYTASVFGTGTITVGFLPGNPSTQNIIPTRYFGTTLTAAPLLGTLGAAVYTLLFLLYIRLCVRRSIRAGEGFEPTGSLLKAPVQAQTEKASRCSFKMLIPLAMPLVCINLLELRPEYGLLCACLATLALYPRTLFRENNLRRTVNEGLAQGVMPLAGFAFCAAFGAVISSGSGYAYAIGLLKRMPGPEILQVVVVTWLASFMMGSSTAGETMALNTLSEHFLAMGISPQVLHRLTTATSIAGGTPYAAPVCNTLELTGLRHRYGYRHYFFVCYVCGTGAILAVTLLAAAGVC